MGIRRRSRELFIQTYYALTYTNTDEYLQHLDYLNKYPDILKELCAETNIEVNSSIYEFADKLLKNTFPRIDEIDKLISKYIGDYGLDKLGIIDLIIIRLAVYEMLYEHVPPAVIINESVELSKKYCAEKSPSLINAVLDKIKDNEVKEDV